MDIFGESITLKVGNSSHHSAFQYIGYHHRTSIDQQNNNCVLFPQRNVVETPERVRRQTNGTKAGQQRPGTERIDTNSYGDIQQGE